MDKIPFTKGNYILFGIAIVLIVLGYGLMTIGPHDSFASLTLAPVMLLAAYVVVLPMAILKKFKKK